MICEQTIVKSRDKRTQSFQRLRSSLPFSIKNTCFKFDEKNVPNLIEKTDYLPSASPKTSTNSFHLLDARILNILESWSSSHLFSSFFWPFSKIYLLDQGCSNAPAYFKTVANLFFLDIIKDTFNVLGKEHLERSALPGKFDWLERIGQFIWKRLEFSEKWILKSQNLSLELTIKIESR